MGSNLILGICGKARSGKDTFATILAEELYKITGNRFVLMAYAHELKLRVQKDFDLSYDQLWGDLKEEPDMRYPKTDNSFWSPRDILQTYGQFFRTIDNRFWVNHLFRKIEDKEYKNVIITDVRHPNEADPVIECGGKIIKVESSRVDKPTIIGNQHISEIAMDDYKNVDFTVVNDSTIDFLRKTAVELVDLILNKL